MSCVLIHYKYLVLKGYYPVGSKDLTQDLIFLDILFRKDLFIE